MNVLEVFIILGSVVGSVLFSGGILWMIFINWTTGFSALGIGSAVIVITMLVALIYYMWEEIERWQSVRSISVATHVGNETRRR